MEKNGSPPSVLVIIAALNEEEGIGSTLAELREVLEDPRYLVVDGNSVDRTVEIAKELGAEVLFQEGSGKGNAIAQAIRYIDSDVKYVVFVDADFTYPVKCVPEMIRILEENPEVGMVTGNRFDRRFDARKAMHNVYYLGNRFLALMQYVLNGVKMRDPLTGLRVVRWEILRDWNPKSKSFDVEAELNYYVERRGYGVREIPIQYRRRLGEKKLKLKHGFTILKRIWMDGIRANF